MNALAERDPLVSELASRTYPGSIPHSDAQIQFQTPKNVPAPIVWAYTQLVGTVARRYAQAGAHALIPPRWWRSSGAAIVKSADCRCGDSP
jgi:hypothetical protein